MNKNAQDVLMGAPGEVTEKQLEELHIKVTASESETTSGAEGEGK